MPRKKTKNHSNPGTKKPKTTFLGRVRRFFVSILWRIFWLSFIAGLVFIGGYFLYVDRIVTDTFEGRRWSIPAEVFAQPTSLYKELSISPLELVSELERLGYQSSNDLTTKGKYRYQAKKIDIHLRDFAFIEGFREGVTVSAYFDQGKVLNLTNREGKEIALVDLEPAKIGTIFPSHGEDRIILTPQEVPNILTEGLIAIEDREFLTHPGFSFAGIARAAFANLRAGETRQGGSTLTQQLVKSYYLSNEQTLIRKLREVAMAIVLELRFSKADLLTAYTNEIFLGQSGSRAIHGFGLGAQYYFNQPLAELETHQLATLISIIRGPSYYNPFRSPDRVISRRNRILDTFYKDGIINKAAHAEAISSPLEVTRGTSRGASYYPAFMDQVRSELKEFYPKDALSSEGMRIFTTLNPTIQEKVQLAVSETLSSIEKERSIELDTLEAAGIVTQSQTGEILAMIAGRDANTHGFNRAISTKRSIGSVIKPVTILTALKAGMDLTDYVGDKEITLQSESGQVWSPKNFDGKTNGVVPLYLALNRSLNLAMVNLGVTLGLEEVQKQFELLTGRKPRNQFPSFLLGAEPMSPIEVSELYSNFASGGFNLKPKAVIGVLDSAGAPLSHHSIVLKQTINPVISNTLNRSLELTMRRGTGRFSSFAKSGVAGKTGTTNDNRDSWFAGFDDNKLAVFWVGRDDNKSTGLSGASGALKLWDASLRRIGNSPLSIPTDETFVDIEYSTGKMARPTCADTVEIPVTDMTKLSTKPGCSLGKTLGERLRSLFTN